MYKLVCKERGYLCHYSSHSVVQFLCCSVASLEQKWRPVHKHKQGITENSTIRQPSSSAIRRWGTLYGARGNSNTVAKVSN